MFDAKVANCNRNRALELIDEDRVDHTYRPAERVASGRGTTTTPTTHE
jgi:hypothetical protein